MDKDSFYERNIPTEADFNVLTQALEQTIVLVEKAAHSITYHSWMSNLNALLKYNRSASHILKKSILNYDDSAL